MSGRDLLSFEIKFVWLSELLHLKSDTNSANVWFEKWTKGWTWKHIDGENFEMIDKTSADD